MSLSLITAQPLSLHAESVPGRAPTGAADASTPPGICVITVGRLERLRTAIRGVAIALGDAGTWREPDAGAAQLTHDEMTGTALPHTYAVGPRRQ